MPTAVATCRYSPLRIAVTKENIKLRISHEGKDIVTIWSDYRRILDWMIGFSDAIYIHLGTTGNTAQSMMNLLYSTPLHTY
jgi:hypothetical protein